MANEYTVSEKPNANSALGPASADRLWRTKPATNPSLNLSFQHLVPRKQGLPIEEKVVTTLLQQPTIPEPPRAHLAPQRSVPDQHRSRTEPHRTDVGSPAPDLIRTLCDVVPQHTTSHQGSADVDPHRTDVDRAAAELVQDIPRSIRHGSTVVQHSADADRSRCAVDQHCCDVVQERSGVDRKVSSVDRYSFFVDRNTRKLASFRRWSERVGEHTGQGFPKVYSISSELPPPPEYHSYRRHVNRAFCG